MKKEAATDLWVHDLLKEAGIELDAQGSSIKKLTMHTEAMILKVLSWRIFLTLTETLSALHLQELR